MVSIDAASHNTPMRILFDSSSNSGDVLAIEDPQSFLQGFDLFLSPCYAVFVTHTCIYTRRLQLLVIRKGCIQLLLSSIKISLLLLESLLLVLLLPGLVLDVFRLLGLVHRRIAHELVILLLCLRFCRTGL